MLLPGSSAAPRSLRFYRDFVRDAPDEVGGGLAFLDRAAGAVPARGAAAASSCRRGRLLRPATPRRARRRSQPLRELGARPPTGRPDALRRSAAAARRAATRTGIQAYLKAELPRASSTTRRSTRSSRTRDARPRRSAQSHVQPSGGAIARVDEDATAFGERQAPLRPQHLLAMWPDPAPTTRAHRLGAAALAEVDEPSRPAAPTSTSSRDEGEARVEAAYGPEKFAPPGRRSRTATTRTTCSALNQNIPPAVTA